MSDSTLLGHVFIFLTTVAGFIFQWLREGRLHEWQRERFDALGRKIENGGQQSLKTD